MLNLNNRTFFHKDSYCARARKAVLLQPILILTIGQLTIRQFIEQLNY